MENSHIQATPQEFSFSVRKKELFEKAQELSTLCDAQVTLVIYSITGEVHQYCSRCTPVENTSYAWLSKEVSQKTNQLREIRDEELQRLDIEDLQELENSLEEGLRRVIEAKDKRIMMEIDTLKRKGAQILEENRSLVHQIIFASSPLGRDVSEAWSSSLDHTSPAGRQVD